MFHHKPSILGVPHLWKPPMDSKWIGIHIVSIPFRMLRPLRAWQQAAILCGKGVPVAKWRLGFSRKVSIYADLWGVPIRHQGTPSHYPGHQPRTLSAGQRRSSRTPSANRGATGHQLSGSSHFSRRAWGGTTCKFLLSTNWHS